MKLTYNASIDRYVVSERGTILHTTPDLDTAQRLAGFEPSPDDYGNGRGRAIAPLDDDADDLDFSDLLEG